MSQILSLLIDGLGLNELQLEKHWPNFFQVPTFSTPNRVRKDNDWFLFQELVVFFLSVF